MENKENTKPVSLIIREGKEKLINCVNELQQLHPTIIDMIVKGVYDEVHRQELLFAEQEVLKYQENLKQQEE